MTFLNFRIAKYDGVEIPVVLDFGSIEVLSVDGEPFTTVGEEPPDATAAFIRVITRIGSVWMPQPEAVGLCAMQKVDILTASYDVIAAALRECAHALLTQYPWQAPIWDTYADALAETWVEYRSGLTPVPYATLAAPIMNTLRGVTIKWRNKTLKHYDPHMWIRTWWIIGFEPQFEAPMPAPDFWNTAGTIPPPGGETTVNITGVHAGGYYYPGIYDGIVSVYWVWDDYDMKDVARFKIKSIAKVTSTGVVTLPS